jgi:hypothetical protein
MKNAHLSVVPRGGFPSLCPNRYQAKKGRRMAATILRAACSSQSVTISELARISSKMTEDQWRTVAFQAGVAVPDVEAKRATVAYLLRVAE